MTSRSSRRRAQPGRPPKLEIDDDLQGRIMAYVRAGAFPERAAAAAGIHASTHYRWRAKGLEERAHRDASGTPRETWQVYLDYVNALEQADAQAELALLARVTAAGPGWKGAMSLLERRFRERWGIKVAVTSKMPKTTARTGSKVDEIGRRREQRGAATDRRRTPS